MENLNLDVDSYTDEELMKLFSLSKDYSAQDATASGDRLIKKVNATKINPEKKQAIDLFVTSCIQRLIAFANSGYQDPNTGTWLQKHNSMIDNTNHSIIANQREIAGKQGPIFTSDVSPGYLNPFSITTLTKGVNIDSRFRKNYYTTSSSDFIFYLPNPLRKVQSMTVAATDIPMSVYAVSKNRGDNAFLIADETTAVSVNGNGTSYVNGNKSITDLNGNQYLYKAWLVILPDGLYELSWQANSEASPLNTMVNNAIALASSGVIDKETGIFYRDLDNYTIDNLNPSSDISFIADRTSGKSIISYPTEAGSEYSGIFTDGFSVHFAIDQYGNRDLDNSIQMKLGWKLGYRIGNYRAGSNSDSTLTNSVLSEGVCLVSPPRYIFISIDDGNKSSNNNYSVAFADSSLEIDIIARINYASDVNSYGAYLLASNAGLDNAMNRTRDYFGPVNIDRLRIRLLDEYGRKIDLNHMDWSMTLSFAIGYE